MRSFSFDRSSAPAELALEVADNLLVALESVPGGGYRWHVDERPGGLVEIAREPHSRDLPVGSPQQSRFVVVAKEPGETLLRFEYGRPWVDESEDSFQIALSIS